MMLSYQYRDFHYRDKTASRPACLYNENPIPVKTVFILIRGSLCRQDVDNYDMINESWYSTSKEVNYATSKYFNHAAAILVSRNDREAISSKCFSV